MTLGVSLPFKAAAPGRPKPPLKFHLGEKRGIALARVFRRPVRW
jgi:hypothetical protein